VDEPWLAHVVIELGAQVLHVAVDRALVALEVVAQHLLDQLHARVNASRIARECHEELVLARGQLELAPVEVHPARRELDGETVVLEPVALGV
jgi:hypothetical protein